ncbi:hypothetical protein ACQEU8_28305 [Streptomyces sp. CA-250714]|uniref:hypothetical protein n=1 Tax=Streptomyces sp. CA-250714 TaxID=3240060 RepID=UPI003D8EB027
MSFVRRAAVSSLFALALATGVGAGAAAAAPAAPDAPGPAAAEQGGWKPGKIHFGPFVVPR